MSEPRILRDPHIRDVEWRMRDLVLEHRWCNGWNSDWSSNSTVFSRTQDRQALWLDLFLYPDSDSPRG